MRPQKMRSMRDIPTIQGLKDRAVPGSREQIMSELAHLEHEKARLERELTIWLTNQRKAQERIHMVEGRVSMLQRAIEELTPRRASSPDEDTDNRNEAKGVHFHVVPLEY